MFDVLVGHEQHEPGFSACLGAVIVQCEVSARGLGLGRPLHNIHAHNVKLREHMLEEGDAPVETERRQLLELIGSLGDGGGVSVLLKRPAAGPLAHIEQVVRVIEMLQYPSVSPSYNNRLGWK